MQVEIDYLDDQISVMEEEPTWEELLSLYGAEMIRKYFIDNLRYRNKHPRVYVKASKELETLVPRAVKSEKKLADGTSKKVFESQIDHLRECYKKDPDRTEAVVTATAQAEPLYVKGTPGGGGKIAQNVLDTANSMFAEGDDKVEAAVTMIESVVIGYKVPRDAENAITPEALARGLQALNKHLLKQSQKQMLSMVGATI